MPKRNDYGTKYCHHHSGKYLKTQNQRKKSCNRSALQYQVEKVVLQLLSVQNVCVDQLQL